MNITQKANKLNVDINWAVYRRCEYLRSQIVLLADKKYNILKSQETHPLGKLLLESKTQEYNDLQMKYAKEILYLFKLQKGRYKQESIDIELIRYQVSILDFCKVGYKRGDRAMCFSPLRDDGKNPSFSVDTAKGVWFDFVIGEGGDVIDLYMRINNLDFKTAINQLSKMI